jgi:hypothetical protein
VNVHHERLATRSVDRLRTAIVRQPFRVSFGTSFRGRFIERHVAAPCRSDAARDVARGRREIVEGGVASSLRCA